MITFPPPRPTPCPRAGRPAPALRPRAPSRPPPRLTLCAPGAEETTSPSPWSPPRHPPPPPPLRRRRLIRPPLLPRPVRRRCRHPPPPPPLRSRPGASTHASGPSKVMSGCQWSTTITRKEKERGAGEGQEEGGQTRETATGKTGELKLLFGAIISFWITCKILLSGLHPAQQHLSNDNSSTMAKRPAFSALGRPSADRARQTASAPCRSTRPPPPPPLPPPLLPPPLTQPPSPPPSSACRSRASSGASPSTTSPTSFRLTTTARTRGGSQRARSWRRPPSQ